jgi:nicotinic acid mononucleotide adenylyltransferase
LVYPRSIQADESISIDENSTGENIEYLSNVPALELSSSQIRALIKQQKSIKYMVPESVERMIKEMGFYR